MKVLTGYLYGGSEILHRSPIILHSMMKSLVLCTYLAPGPVPPSDLEVVITVQTQLPKVRGEFSALADNLLLFSSCCAGEESLRS